MIINYNPKLKQLAKNLRKNSTLSEVLLWNYLKNKRMKGYDWHRQKPIDNYIADFYCPALKLVIEIDGASHGGKEKYDEIRIKKLESLGLHVLIFDDMEIKNNIGDVLTEIIDHINKYRLHTPSKIVQ